VPKFIAIMTQPNQPDPTWTCTLFAHQTFGVTDDPKNPPIATFDFQAASAFLIPDSVSWNGRIFLNEKLGSEGGPITLAFYELHPVNVSPTPK